MKIIVFVLMILAHLISDFIIQGWFMNGKQKIWWEKVAPDKKYANDYIMALICHSTMWSIITMLPLLLLKINLYLWLFLIIANVMIHSVVDNEKANKLSINLWQDQIFHMLQIIITFILINI